MYKNYSPSLVFSKIRKTWSFQVVGEEDGKEIIYNAPPKLLFYSLKLLFGGVLVAVAVAICLSFLITEFDNVLRFQAIFKQTQQT